MIFSPSKDIAERETLVEVVQASINSLKIKVSEQRIAHLLLRHPAYPNLPSLLDTLNTLKIDNKAIKLRPEQLRQLQPNFFAHLPYEGIVFVGEINQNTITYFSPISGWTKLDKQIFIDKWSGIVVLIDGENVPTEENYWFKKFIESIKRFRNLIIVAISLLPVLMHTFVYNITLTTPLLLVKTVGLVICALLSTAVVNNNAGFFEQCRIGSKISCQSVLRSSASKLFGWISVLDAGLIYFFGTLVFASLTLSSSASVDYESLLLLGTASILAFPYTLFAIYYQAAVIKKWCLYCLSVTILLWVEGFISLTLLSKSSIMLPDIPTVTLLMLSLATPFLLWIYIKDTILENVSHRSIKNQFYRLISNMPVFDALHLKSPVVDTEFKENYIMIGDNEAKHTICLVMNMVCPTCIKVCNELLDLLPSFRNMLKLKLILIDDLPGAKVVTSNSPASIINSYLHLGESDFILFLKNILNSQNTEKIQLPVSNAIPEKVLETRVYDKFPIMRRFCTTE